MPTIPEVVSRTLHRTPPRLGFKSPGQPATDAVDIQAPAGRAGWSAAYDLLSGLGEDSHANLAALARDIAASQDALGGWKASAQAAGPDADSSVLNHVALSTYLRRLEHAREFSSKYTEANHARFAPDPDTVANLTTALQKSWTHLTGKVPKGDRQLGPLPDRVLKKVHTAPAAVHEVLLGDSLEVRIDPHGSLARALELTNQGVAGVALESQPGRLLSKKVLQAVGVGATGLATAVALRYGVLSSAALLAASGPLLRVAAGFVSGWLTASLDESVFHDKIGHIHDLPGHSLPLREGQKPSIGRQIYERAPEWVQKPMFNLWFGHTKIHHFRTFTKDHVTQFRNPEEQNKLDTYLIKQGQEALIDAEYGITMDWKSSLKYLATAAPTYTVALGTALLFGAGPLFAAGFAVPAASFPLWSKSYHRYTHMPAKQALETAPFPLRLYLQTPLSRFTVRHHFVHHEDPSVNFNLMPGADFIRGTSRKPSVAQTEELRRLGVLF